jgi:phage host-nuclease inhibitor protein Gam
MATKQRIKAVAQQRVAQSESDVAGMIRNVGDVSREIQRLQAAMNDEIAEITARYEKLIQPERENLMSLQSGVQTWCEAHRETLTNSGKVKTYGFITGQVQWRQRPPSVQVRGVDAVLDLLRDRGMYSLIRTKEEINKEAILNEPDSIKGMRGITIVTGVEDFVIEPFEQKVEVQ